METGNSLRQAALVRRKEEAEEALRRKHAPAVEILMELAAHLGLPRTIDDLSGTLLFDEDIRFGVRNSFGWDNDAYCNQFNPSTLVVYKGKRRSSVSNVFKQSQSTDKKVKMPPSDELKIIIGKALLQIDQDAERARTRRERVESMLASVRSALRLVWRGKTRKPSKEAHDLE